MSIVTMYFPLIWVFEFRLVSHLIRPLSKVEIGHGSLSHPQDLMSPLSKDETDYGRCSHYCH